MGNPSPKRRLFHGHWVTVGGGWAGGGTSTRQAMGRVYRRPGAGQCKRRFCMQISIRRALTGVLQASFLLAALVIGGMDLRRGACTDDG